VRDPPRYANDSSYAWYQSFNNGNQNYNHMDNKLRGCAVRRSTQTGTCWDFFFEVRMTCSFQELVQAYTDCRRNKRSSSAAATFEFEQEQNLVQLYNDLVSGTYRPGGSICFVIKRPKPREVWAAPYRDRIVHHLVYNKIAPRFEATFIADSCACIPGRGTLYGAQRLEAKVRSLTQNWTLPAYYLKCDLANFFVSIHKPTLDALLTYRIREPWWLRLVRTLLHNDPRQGALLQSSAADIALIPRHKSLFNQSREFGLPIGNLSSQFFANVLLNPLDQFAKHNIRARHYMRYVDDFVLLHESLEWLEQARRQIDFFLPRRLNLHLNHRKTVIQPLDRGIDFVGHVIKPHRRTIRRRSVNDAVHRLEQMPAADVYAAANSYFGLLRQATHSRRDRERLAIAAQCRGLWVDGQLTKTYPRHRI